MNKVAIISDSHGALDRLGEALANLESGKIREIIHAGDFALGEIVKLLQKFPNLNFRIAIGNCDVDEETLAKIQELPNVKLAKILEFEIEERKFAVAHRSEDLREIENAEILISGHTHVPHIEKIHGKLFVNPGSLMDGGKYILLDLKNLTIEGKLFNEKIG